MSCKLKLSLCDHLLSGQSPAEYRHILVACSTLLEQDRFMKCIKPEKESIAEEPIAFVKFDHDP